MIGQFAVGFVWHNTLKSPLVDYQQYTVKRYNSYILGRVSWSDLWFVFIWACVSIGILETGGGNTQSRLIYESLSSALHFMSEHLVAYSLMTRPTETERVISHMAGCGLRYCLASASLLHPFTHSYHTLTWRCSFITVLTWKYHESYSRSHASEDLDDSSIYDRPCYFVSRSRVLYLPA